MVLPDKCFVLEIPFGMEGRGREEHDKSWVTETVGERGQGTDWERSVLEQQIHTKAD